MKNFLNALSGTSNVTQAIVLRAWANSALAALMGRVATVIRREQKALARGGSEAYSDMREEAQSDNQGDHPIGTDSKLTLSLLVEWTAAVSMTAMTQSEAFEGTERRYAQPMPLKDTAEFLRTPNTKVNDDQIEAVLEEEPELGRAGAIALLQQMAIDDAKNFRLIESLVLSRTEEFLADAPADREFDAIACDLPEEYQERMLDKARTKLSVEISRLLPLVIKGVPNVADKRRQLKADMPKLEASTFEPPVAAAA